MRRVLQTCYIQFIIDLSYTYIYIHVLICIYAWFLSYHSWYFSIFFKHLNYEQVRFSAGAWAYQLHGWDTWRLMVAPVATDWPLILSMAHDISNLTKTSEKANDQVEIFQGWQQVFGGFRCESWPTDHSFFPEKPAEGSLKTWHFSRRMVIIQLPNSHAEQCG